MTFSEQEFKNTLLVGLSRTKRVRVWIQPAGKILTKRSTAVQGAPIGAADITGIALGYGIRLELECKNVRTEVSPGQIHWLEEVRSWGGIALLLRVAKGETLEQAVARCVGEVLAAIDARCTEVVL